MWDDFGRKIKYLRLSVTDLCQYRCIYCMPSQGVEKLAHSQMLSVDECVDVTRACVELGVEKVRITGGEPLVRRGILDICRGIAAIDGVKELCMTTNGALLPKYAKDLKAAGVHRLNISMDTLNPEKFRRITRVGELEQALVGLAAAEEAGFTGTKINCVLLGGINDDEIAAMAALTRDRDIDVRFIELMPIGECARWDKERFLSGEAVLRALPEAREAGYSGVARLYALPGHKGRIGLIDPLSHKFCSDCDKIRITADGKLKPCLHSAREFPLKGLRGEALKEAIGQAIAAKPREHHMDATHASDSLRGMSKIGG